MHTLTRAVLGHPLRVVTVWLILLAVAAFFALRLPEVVRGSSDNIQDSESGRAADLMERRFGPGSAYLFAVVVEGEQIVSIDPEFAAGVEAVARTLGSVHGVKSVDHYWNTGATELLGRDGHSALILVRPSVAAFFEAEHLTGALRAALSRVPARPGVTATVTGMPALFYDLNRNSSTDLLRAERIGIPLTLAILLIVFGAPLAAALPLIVALVAVTTASAGLYLFSSWLPVSVFAQNVVAMIGLGVGVDYALFLLSRFRAQLEQGNPVRDAVARACVAAGHAVLVSGIAVGIGFMGLLLVNAKFVHSIALGGLLVVASAVAVTLTLLPVLLLWLGHSLNWPRARRRTGGTILAGTGSWERWIGLIMLRPWHYLLPGLAIVAALIVPALRMATTNAGVKDLAPQVEARRGFESLQRNFEAGWMGPIALLVESAHGASVDDAASYRAIEAIAARLSLDPRIARVQLDPRHAVSPDGKAALLVLVTKHGPDSAEALELVKALRADRWPEAKRFGLGVRVGGPTAMIEDFDAEIFGSLWRVIPAVLAATFVVLLVAFRSLLIPLKAIVLNLLSVLAAYGFLVLVFQDGVGASMLGIDPPGGLNSLVVLMLFTILFGISMDYEVFLMSRIREAYAGGADNRHAVASGVSRSASIITSAAVIMVVLFGSFGFTRLTATREFGLGLAFAVALDATLIRLLLVPALMELFGDANWWWSGSNMNRHNGPHLPARHSS